MIGGRQEIDSNSHMGPRSAIASAKHFGAYDVIPGGVIMCEPCMVGKSKRSVIRKKSSHTSNKPNGTVYTDITTIRQVGGKVLKRGVWLEIKDEYSKYSTSLFMERKSEMPGIMCQLFSHWRALGKKVDIVRCDNATESENFELKAKKKAIY